MPVGRPRRAGETQDCKELVDLAEWFERERNAAGYETTHAFLRATEAARGQLGMDKNAVYDIFGARRLRDLESIRRLAVSLGRPAGEATALWERANRRLGRAELVRRGQAYGAIADWSAVPLPEPWLESLLRGQATAAEQFPYDLLGVRKPPLSEVYVEQDVQPLTVKVGGDVESPDRVVREGAAATTLTGALSVHDHLFITGGPGAGKTTLGQHLVRQIALYWLREEGAETPWCAEPMVGLRIASADLLTRQPWTQLLSEAAGRTGTQLTPVEPEFLRRPAQGVRWLVVVDGLDEISAPSERALILKSLAQLMQSNRLYRLVITSRTLPQGELGPFEEVGGIGFYTLKGGALCPIRDRAPGLNQ